MGQLLDLYLKRGISLQTKEDLEAADIGLSLSIVMNPYLLFLKEREIPRVIFEKTRQAMDEFCLTWDDVRQNAIKGIDIMISALSDDHATS